MIDRFGNKITPPSGKQAAPHFLKAEIQFLLKGYAKDPTDGKAELMSVKGELLASNLLKSLTVSSDLALLEELIHAMTEHCMHTKNRNISWYMAWLCRDLYRIEKSLTRTSDTDYLAMSAYFFERYEVVEPTDQGRNLLINTYCSQATRLMEAKDRKKDLQALELLQKAKACEERMHPEYSRHNRFLICQNFYTTFYQLCNRMNRQEEAYEALVKLIHYTRKKLQEKQENLDMRRLADYCCRCIAHPLYDRKADPIGLQDIVATIDRFCNQQFTYGIVRHLEILKKFLENKD